MNKDLRNIVFGLLVSITAIMVIGLLGYTVENLTIKPISLLVTVGMVYLSRYYFKRYIR